MYTLNNRFTCVFTGSRTKRQPLKRKKVIEVMIPLGVLSMLIRVCTSAPARGRAYQHTWQEVAFPRRIPNGNQGSRQVLRRRSEYSFLPPAGIRELFRFFSSAEQIFFPRRSLCAMGFVERGGGSNGRYRQTERAGLQRKRY